MARVQRRRAGAIAYLPALLLALSLAVLCGPAARAQSLYERPVLTVDPGMHTALFKKTAVDAAGRYAVTGSEDKTVRIWSLADGALLRTIRVPAGPGDIGKIFAVAMSPDGKLVAAGGWTRFSQSDPQEQIYLFDRETGAMAARIAGLPNATLDLAFSPDGRYLAAVLGESNGLRIYDRDQAWKEVFRDADYEGDSYGVAFAADGRLATTCFDGKVRLYDRDFHLKAVKETTGGQRPTRLAFSPDGNLLAVGFVDTTSVDLLDAQSLERLPGPDTSGIDNGALTDVAWSADGETLYAGGMYQDVDGDYPVIAWADAGLEERRTLPPLGSNTVYAIVPLPKGGLLVANGDPALGVLNAGGALLWRHGFPQADFRDQDKALSVSADGTIVDFGFGQFGKLPLRFDLGKLALTSDPPDDGRTGQPKQVGLQIDGWKNTRGPTLDGEAIELNSFETSRSLAIHPDGERFALGADWNLRAYDAEGEQLWRRAVPGVVWAVNITGDGRMVVAAYGDGTIRWHRMDDGRELLAFMVLSDKKNWVAWTPEGFYGATPGAIGVLQWHVNSKKGFDAAGFTVPVSKIPKLSRPDALALVLQELETARALGVADMAAARYDVLLATGAAKAPGARLHVLTIGVSKYGDKAKHLRLKYAHKDARDVASALVNTQGSVFNKEGGLYAEVLPIYLHDDTADKVGIAEAFASMQRLMANGSNGQDLAVVMFSGHGTVIDGRFYLLPYGVDANTQASIKASAIPASEFQAEIAKLAEHGRVLVLLDACRSGAATADGSKLTPNADLLRAAMSLSNVTVLTSSKADKLSREDKKWENGAFTEVLLEAFGRAADADNNSLISMGELTSYVAANLPVLTGGDQHPGMEQRFQSDLFVAGL